MLFENKLTKKMMKMAGLSEQKIKSVMTRLDEATWKQMYMTLEAHIENTIKRLQLLTKVPHFVNLEMKDTLLSNINKIVEALTQSKEMLNAPVQPQEQVYKISEILTSLKISGDSVQQICNLVAGSKTPQDFLQDASQDEVSPQQKQLVRLFFTDSAGVWMKHLEMKLKDMFRDPEEWTNKSNPPSPTEVRSGKKVDRFMLEKKKVR